MPIQALLVDDDYVIAQMLQKALAREQIASVHCATLNCAFTKLSDSHFDIALVDRTLHDRDGLDFVVHARRARPEMGIIIISATSVPDERVKGLETGADDYLAKPLDLREVVIKVQRLTSRHRLAARAKEARYFHFEPFILDPYARTLRHQSEGRIPLTGHEFGLVHTLAMAANRAVSREAIQSAIYGRKTCSSERTVDNLVSSIRRKLREVGCDDLILTLRGKGYVLGLAVTASH